VCQCDWIKKLFNHPFVFLQPRIKQMIMSNERYMGRTVFAVAAMFLLAVAVCSVLGADGRTVLLVAQKARLSSVFTTADENTILKIEAAAEEGRQELLEKHIEALRFSAAREHELHERALQENDIKGEKRVLALDRHFVSETTQLKAASEQAEQREQQFQKRIEHYRKLEASAREHHQQYIKMLQSNSTQTGKDALILKMEGSKHLDEQANKSVLSAAEHIQQQLAAANQAHESEEQFEEKVDKYRADGLKLDAALDVKLEAALGTQRKSAQEMLIAAEHHDAQRQMEFKTSVREEAEKAESLSYQRMLAVKDALQKVHAEVRFDTDMLG
jgi:hypothetical protein